LRRRHVRRLHGRKDLQLIRGARLERAARNYW
jgi:hypothetical protein